MKAIDRFLLWLGRHEIRRHRRWLRKARVVGYPPSPRSIVYRKWNVPL